LAVPAVQAAGQCLPPDAPAAISARNTLVAAYQADSLGAFWSSYHVQGGSEEIVVVDELAKCRTAIATLIEAGRLDAPFPRAILLRAGDRFVLLSQGEWASTFAQLDEFDDRITLHPRRDATLIVALGEPPPPTSSLCFGAETDFSRFTSARIRRSLTDPRGAKYQELLGTGDEVIQSLNHVDDAETCARAIAAIRAHLDRTDATVRIALFRVGRGFWAASSAPRAGEWSMTFILDATATRVVGQD